MRDRQITENEINRITEKCQTREKAFFTVMRQSGLPPHIIKQLKIRNLERILEPDTPIPCKVKRDNLSTPDFIGEEAVKYLKLYLKTRTRPNPTPESFLFTIRNNPNKQINTKDVSRAFRLATQKSINRSITRELKKGEPSELRLYSLIKFYRKKAEDYLKELNNNSTATDDEFNRKLYEEKARPKLEIEPPTPIQIQRLERENRELKERLTKFENTLLPVTRLYYESLGLVPKSILSELKPDIPIKNMEDREQRIQKTLHKIAESIRREDSKHANQKRRSYQKTQPRKLSS